MKKLFSTLALFVVGLSTITASFADATMTAFSPVGVWKTIDDVTGKPKALVQLWQSTDNKLYGKILKVFPRKDVPINANCIACEGEKHNQPINGLVFLESLKQSGKNKIEWSGGKILDPKNGKSYHCSLQVLDNGKKLNVRGYLGLPLFGRTQTWVKESAVTA
jgi:uncharacterized protein (DUF2147 family)